MNAIFDSHQLKRELEKLSFSIDSPTIPINILVIYLDSSSPMKYLLDFVRSSSIHPLDTKSPSEYSRKHKRKRTKRQIRSISKIITKTMNFLHFRVKEIDWMARRKSAINLSRHQCNEWVPWCFDKLQSCLVVTIDGQIFSLLSNRPTFEVYPIIAIRTVTFVSIVRWSQLVTGSTNQPTRITMTPVSKPSKDQGFR